MQINIVNKYTHTPQPNDVYVGRGSALGNPMPIAPKIGNTRDKVCDAYAEHIKNITADMAKQLNHIVRIGDQYGEVNLVCFCAPQRCHAESIRQLIEDTLKEVRK